MEVERTEIRFPSLTPLCAMINIIIMIVMDTPVPNCFSIRRNTIPIIIISATKPAVSAITNAGIISLKAFTRTMV